MNTRLSLLLSALTALAIPAAYAGEVTFTFTPSNGNPAITLTLPTDDIQYDGTLFAAANNAFDPNRTNFIRFDFYNPQAFAEATQSSDVVLDLRVQYSDNGTELYTLDGPALFNFDASEITPVYGTFQLAEDPINALAGPGNDLEAAAGTLVISDGIPSAATPEPSSLFLLGTGALSLAGATRRRLRKA